MYSFHQSGSGIFYLLQTFFVAGVTKQGTGNRELDFELSQFSQIPEIKDLNIWELDAVKDILKGCGWQG